MYTLPHEATHLEVIPKQSSDDDVRYRRGRSD